MNTNETECNGAYDRACRDPRDNCPTEGAVLKREWRQKTAAIAILSATLEQQIARFEKLRAAAAALLDDMGEPDDGAEANLMQAVRDALDAPGPNVRAKQRPEHHDAARADGLGPSA